MFVYECNVIINDATPWGKKYKQENKSLFHLSTVDGEWNMSFKKNSVN